MNNFKDRFGTILTDCLVTIVTTVIVDTSVKVLEYAFDTWFFGDTEEPQQQTVSIEELLKAIQETEDEERAECDDCDSCFK